MPTLVISSDDALFGHPSFRYYGWGPRMWWWAQTMGIRKFQEMVFTGRAFTAEEMYDCNFLNSVVPRDQLEAEVAEVRAGLRTQSPHRHGVHAEGLLRDHEAVPGRVSWAACSAASSSRWAAVSARMRCDDLMLDDAIERGLGKAVKDNDDKFPAGMAR